jgi:hypothetical protein
MAAEQGGANRTNVIFIIVFCAATLVTGVAQGYALYQSDQCSRTLETRLDSVKARLDAAKGAIQKK